MDPVAPRRATRLIDSSVGTRRSHVSEAENEVERRGGGEEEGVDAIEDASVAAEEPSRVLHLHVALQHRLEQVAREGGDDDDQTQHERLPDGEVVASILVEGDERDEDA